MTATAPRGVKPALAQDTKDLTNAPPAHSHLLSRQRPNGAVSCRIITRADLAGVVRQIEEQRADVRNEIDPKLAGLQIRYMHADSPATHVGIRAYSNVVCQERQNRSWHTTMTTR